MNTHCRSGTDKAVHQAQSGLNQTSLNLYAYVEGRTLKAIDPDGLRIELVGLTAEQRNVALVEMQKLTNDVLSIVETKVGGGIGCSAGSGRSVYTIEVVGSGDDRGLTKGTELVGRLIKSERTVQIMHEAKGSMQGTQNPSVRLDLSKSAKQNQSWVQDRVTGELKWEATLRHIVLAHELSHADKTIRQSEGSGWVKNPYNPSARPGQPEWYWVEERRIELETIGVPGFVREGDITENDIRVDQGLNLRYSHEGKAPDAE